MFCLFVFQLFSTYCTAHSQLTALWPAQSVSHNLSFSFQILLIPKKSSFFLMTYLTYTYTRPNRINSQLPHLGVAAIKEQDGQIQTVLTEYCCHTFLKTCVHMISTTFLEECTWNNQLLWLCDQVILKFCIYQSLTTSWGVSKQGFSLMRIKLSQAFKSCENLKIA